jgi:RNA polymerase sigma-70 factor, ECF subfamily
MSSPLSRTAVPPVSNRPPANAACELSETLVHLEQAVEFFTHARPRLFAIACRVMGNAVDAEDVVQDVWVRWQSCDRGVVQAPSAFLATTATRLAINVIQSARARHETCLGSPNAGTSDPAADPALGTERREDLESAVLLLLERLSPAERAAYVLREAFEYPYQRIAEIIQATEVTTRQLVSRARKRLATERQKSVAVAERTRFFTAFLAAAQTGQLTVLEQLLAADVISSTDTGRQTRARHRLPLANAA